MIFLIRRGFQKNGNIVATRRAFVLNVELERAFILAATLWASSSHT